MEIIQGKIKSAQKIVVYGVEGIGKSTFASRFPSPLFIDTEGSTKHMDISRTPTPSSWTMLLDQAQYVKRNPTICKTLVIDTADWAERMCEQTVCAKAGKAGIEDFGYGKGYTYLGDEFGKLLNLLQEVIAVGVNVVFTAHAQMRKFEQPDELGSYDRWEMKLSKKTAPLLREWADMVLFVNYETYVIKSDNKLEKGKAQGGKRIMHTTHHPCWDAKNRHDLKDKLPFDYGEIAQCFGGASQISAAVPIQETVGNITQEEPVITQSTPQADPTPIPVAPTINSSEWDDIPSALADLMKTNNVLPEEIRAVVAKKGYYPASMPIGKYDHSFIDGVLIGAWEQVFQAIDSERLPF